MDIYILLKVNQLICSNSTLELALMNDVSFGGSRPSTLMLFLEICLLLSIQSDCPSGMNALMALVAIASLVA